MVNIGKADDRGVSALISPETGQKTGSLLYYF
jgi:hypothetical protein